MEWMIEKGKMIGETFLKISLGLIGSDILMCIEGGGRPHIGCTVQAISRKSLTGSGENSVTSSVINVTGHKDEFLCRKAAEAVCSALGTNVVCTGGFHMDHMSPSQIQEVLQGADKLVKELEIELGKLEEDFGKNFGKKFEKKPEKNLNDK